MESTVSSVRRRLVTRRALPWLAWAGTFAGIGWGVYQFGPTGDDAAAMQPAAADQQAADSAAKQQIKQLFASAPNETPAATAEPSNHHDRYAVAPVSAPPLPLPVQESADDVATPRNAADIADARYAIDKNLGAAALPLPPPANDEAGEAASEDETVVDAMPVVEEPDVARGQEPANANPLRQAHHEVSAPLGSPEQARAAFEQTRNQPEVVQVGREHRTVDARNAALNTARPLPAASRRYGNESASPTPVAMEPTRAEGPTPSFANDARQPTPQPAAPAYDFPDPAERTAANPTTPNFARTDGQPDYGQPTPALAPERGITPTPGLSGPVGAGRPGERLLEGPQSPAISIQKLAPPEIQVGKKCTFAIRVKNNGQRAAQQVVVNDEVPMGTQLVGTAPRADVSGAQVQWDLGTLSVGEERIVEMELIPTDEGELGSVAMVTFAAEASAKARCTKPELRLQLTSKPSVMVGEQHLVQVEVSNPGSGDATNVMLLESLPPGISHEAGTALEFEIGTLRAGQSRKLELVLNAEQAGVIENVMTARADANLQAAASCQFEIVAPGLALSVDGPKRKYLERPATFIVNVDNPGTAAAMDVQLVAQLPKGLQYVNANNMGEYDQATHSVYWSLAELPANERGTVELTALPIAPGDHTIKAATKAQQGLEDRAEQMLQVEGMAALSFETRALDNLIEIGGETTCEIRVTNRGSKAASNVQVAAVMPPGLRAVTAKGDTQHSLQGNQVAFSPLLQLAPGAEAIFHVTAEGVAPGDQRVKVRVTSDDEQPITKEASARVYADQ